MIQPFIDVLLCTLHLESSFSVDSTLPIFANPVNLTVECGIKANKRSYPGGKPARCQSLSDRGPLSGPKRDQHYRYLGQSSQVAVDLLQCDVAVNDLVLLCTNGALAYAARRTPRRFFAERPGG